jgi:protein-tyrosine phosphatase
VMPRGIEAALHEFAIQELVAVIAHPERNPLFARNPDLLADLVARGAITQITAGSILGDFGRWAREASQEFFERGLVHVVASDAHSVGQRPPRLGAAREWVKRTWGTEAEEGLFEANPKSIVDSEPLAWLP